MATGWRGTSDDAGIAWRAWNVLSVHPPLLGAPTHTMGLGHQAFAPGPALSWLLAVAVHLDPAQGALWGSTLISLAAVALTIEAGWAAGGRWGSLGAAASVLVVATTETAILMNPLWTPWQGALWLLAAMMCAWAAANGNWRWWPATVIAASIASQAHVVFAPTAVAVILVSPLVCLVVLHRGAGAQDRTENDPAVLSPSRRSGTWPLVVGVVVGIVLWLPPMIDQLVGIPGNLTLLWRSSRAAGGHVGYSRAFQGLGAGTWPLPSWSHRLPTSGQRAFLSIMATTFHGSLWRGVVTLVALATLGAWCTVTRRTVVAALAWTALAAGSAAVVTIAQTPATDAFELVYLGVLYWVVGTVAVGALFAGAVKVVSAVVGVRPGAPDALRIGGVAVTLGLLGLVGLSVGVTIVDGASLPNELSVQGGPPIAVLSDRAAVAVAAVAPRGSFVLLLGGSASIDRSSAAYSAITYNLVTRGLAVRLPLAFAVGDDASRAARGRLPSVTVDISTQHPSAHVGPPAAT
jgi:hypothetical protein